MKAFDIKRLIAEVGGVAVLAAACGRGVTAIRKWAETGVPYESAQEHLLYMAGNALKSDPSDLEAFQYALEMAGVDVKLMRLKNEVRKLEKKRSTGTEFVLGTNTQLTEEMVEKALFWMGQLKGRLERWQVRVKMSMYKYGADHVMEDMGRYQHAQLYKELPIPDPTEFTLQQWMFTGGWRRKEDAIRQFRVRMQNIFDLGIYAFCHGISVYNDRRRTDSEIETRELFGNIIRRSRYRIGDLTRMFFISDLADMFGVPESTIRTWKEKGLAKTEANKERLKEVRDAVFGPDYVWWRISSYREREREAHYAATIADQESMRERGARAEREEAKVAAIRAQIPKKLGALTRRFFADDLADMFGVSKETMGKWVKKGMPSSPENLAQLQRVKDAVKDGDYDWWLKTEYKKREREEAREIAQAEVAIHRREQERENKRLAREKARELEAKRQQKRAEQANRQLRALTRRFDDEMLAAMFNISRARMRGWLKKGMPATEYNLEWLEELRAEIRKGQWNEYTKKALR